MVNINLKELARETFAKLIPHTTSVKNVGTIFTALKEVFKLKNTDSGFWAKDALDQAIPIWEEMINSNKVSLRPLREVRKEFNQAWFWFASDWQIMYLPDASDKFDNCPVIGIRKPDMTNIAPSSIGNNTTVSEETEHTCKRSGNAQVGGSQFTDNYLPDKWWEILSDIHLARQSGGGFYLWCSEIPKGIFGKTEREAILNAISECQKKENNNE